MLHVRLHSGKIVGIREDTAVVQGTGEENGEHYKEYGISNVQRRFDSEAQRREP